MKMQTHKKHIFSGFRTYISEFDKVCTSMLLVAMNAAIFSLLGVGAMIVNDMVCGIYPFEAVYFPLIEHIMRFLTLTVFFTLLFDYIRRSCE